MLVSTLAGMLATATALPATFSSTNVLPNLAAIQSVNNTQEFHEGGLVRSKINLKRDTLETRGGCATSSQFTWGDQDNGQPGLVVTNGANQWMGFYVYANSCDSVPLEHFWLAPSATQFISLPAGFQGRVTRGTDAMNLSGKPQLLGTWLELSFDPSNRNLLWGDVSLIQGCDGGMLMWALDGTGSWKGFTQDILAKAPAGVWAQKPDGTWVLAQNEGPHADAITTRYELQAVGASNAYIDDAHGNPVINSRNGRYGVWMSQGRI